MSGAEVFAGLGLLATELFRYNRENFQFDQDQRFEKEELRLKMQLERFALFREDIRDLVELTVGKMDLYHLVGALFLKGCVVYFAEGQIYKPPPTFLLALYYLSLSCAFVYLALSVWLAMHASIASHSQGTRLLTRFVRLPIPGGRTLDRLNARLSDFERQDKKDVLRVPFISGTENNWRQRSELEGSERRPPPEEQTSPTGARGAPGARDVRPEWSAPRETHAWPSVGKAALRAGAPAGTENLSGDVSGKLASLSKKNGHEAPVPSIYGAQHMTLQMSPRQQGKDPFCRVSSPTEHGTLVRTRSLDSRRSASSGSACDWLESGEYGYGGSKDLKDNESELLQAVEMKTQRHVQLFRQLQARWQCYDAYARVCMSLGVRQLIQAVTYFLIGVFAVDCQQLMSAFMVTVVFQALAVAISVLDIHGLPCYGNLDLSLVGMLPALVACSALCLAPRDEEGTLVKDHSYVLALAAYPLEICWFEILHWVASPNREEAAVPSHFRNVLFMDVFGEVDDPTEADLTTGKRILTPEERFQVQMRVATAESALGTAQAALRRWEAVPASWLTLVQRKRLRRARRELAVWTHMLDWELEQRKLPKVCGQQQFRSWRQLTPTEQEDDPFAGMAIGPFEHFTGTGLQRNFYYDLEHDSFLHDLEGDSKVLRLSQATKAVRKFRKTVDAVRREASGQIKPPQGSQGRSLSFASSIATSRPETPTGLVRTRSALSASTTSASPRPLSRTGSMGSKPVKIKVPRLPWFLTSFLTRIVQATWVFAGLVGCMRELGIVTIDFQEANIEEGRRLQEEPEAAPLHFDPVEVAWPHGPFFRPESLSRLDRGALLVSSPYAVYRASTAERLDGQALRLEELPFSPDPPPAGTAFICGSQQATELPCLLAAPSPRGVAVWRPSERWADATVLEVEGSPWRSVAGAAVPCGGEVEAGDASAAPWCLLLVGWLGGQELSALLVELPGGFSELLPPQRGALILQHFTISLAAPAAAAPAAASTALPTAAGSSSVSAAGLSSVSAAMWGSPRAAPTVRVEPWTGRLWVLADGSSLEAWDLLPLPARRVGRWTFSAPSQASGLKAQRGEGFLPRALCEDPAGQSLFVVGQMLGKDPGPVLLRAAAPLAIAQEENVPWDTVAGRQ